MVREGKREKGNEMKGGRKGRREGKGLCPELMLFLFNFRPTLKVILLHLNAVKDVNFIT